MRSPVIRCLVFALTAFSRAGFPLVERGDLVDLPEIADLDRRLPSVADRDGESLVFQNFLERVERLGSGAHALGEVVKLHGQFGRREVDADVLLAGNSERGVLLVVVLNLKGSAVRNQSAVRKTDAEGRADLSAFYSERVVILTVYSARKDKIILKDLKSLASNHVNC